MEIAVYSDVHLYNHHKLLVNSETALNSITFVKNYCVSNGIKMLICAGDFYHTKARAYAPHVIQARLRLKDIQKSGIEHYMIIGNHDMANQNNTMNSIVFAFNEYAKIIPDYFYLDIDNTRIHFMSYTTKLFPHFILSEDKKNVLIAHLDIIGFTMSNGFRSEAGFKMSDLKDFDLVITGHYHKHQVSENIVYTGSTHQTSFGERDQIHGFIVFDTETLKYRLVENTEAPKYKIIEIKKYDDIIDNEVKNNFLRVKILSNKLSNTKLKEILFEKGALSVDLIPLEDAKEIGKYYEKTLSDIPTEIAASYISNLKDIKLDKHKLLSYFNKIEEVANRITEYELVDEEE